MMKSKATAVLVGTALALAAIGGCSTSDGSGSAPSSDAPVATEGTDQAKVVFLYLNDWSSENADGVKRIDSVVEEFERQNPDIDVELEGYGFAEMFQQIQIRSQSGDTTPDVITVDSPRNSSYGLRGWLEPLDGLYTEEEIADWQDQPLASATYDSKLMSAPWVNATQLLFYNKALLAAAGVAYPGEAERLTWEQVVEAAQKVKESNPDVSALDFEQRTAIYQLQPLAGSLGGAPLGEDGLSAEGIINSPEWVEAMTFYQNIYNDWGLAPQSDAVGTTDAFVDGKVAMMVAGPWNIGRFVGAMDPEIWGVSRHPYFEAGEPSNPTGAWNLGLNPNSENKEAAKRFIKFMTTAEGINLWWKAPGDAPASESVVAQIETDSTFGSWPQSAFKVMARESTVNPVLRPVTVGYLEYEEIMGRAFADIRNGADVKESLDLAAQALEREFAKYQP